ncbi:GEM-like protein 5 [Hibiscus syriacus]|uniref:GEM-like protein 5 n=1 Tax=Hibiscus syriacus TaxID=106335 RepID=A0A6A3CBV1_HIBSY|nr:GEM-like protein 5 [Hibiscus syriacus]
MDSTRVLNELKRAARYSTRKALELHFRVFESSRAQQYSSSTRLVYIPRHNLSTARVGYCSDCPLSFIAPSGHETWSYYKVVIKENLTPESYIELVTVDGHDFWVMGFVKFEKASSPLLNNVHDFKGTD